MPSEKRKVWFAQTVEEKKHSLYRVALTMLRSTADAEDAVSDAIEATWRQLDRIRSDQALQVFLFVSSLF